MKRLLLISAIAAVAALALSPRGASADRLHFASPETPLAFTWPAVRFWHPPVRVTHVRRYARVVKRVRVARYARYARSGQRIARVSYGCQRQHFPYMYPPTGYTPLPYEFGPPCAAIVARY
jgi:hypothetical protein